MIEHAWLIALLPVAAFVLIIAFGRKLPGSVCCGNDNFHEGFKLIRAQFPQHKVQHDVVFM